MYLCHIFKYSSFALTLFCDVTIVFSCLNDCSSILKPPVDFHCKQYSFVNT